MPSRRSSRPSAALSRPLRSLLGVVLVSLPLALGGAHASVNLALAALLTAALLLALRRHRLSLNLPILLVALAFAATLLQLVPLPLALVRAVSPGATEVLAVSLGDGARFAPLSLDPPATAHEALKLAAYLAAAILAVLLFDDRSRRRRLATWIAAAGAAVALLGFAHALAGVEQPYGLFGRAGRQLTSAFINPNHLAGFLGLAAMLALGLAMTARDRWRFVHLGAAVLMGAGVILSLSRGGIIAFLAALLFLGVTLALRRGDRASGIVSVQVALAGALLVAGYLAYTQVVREMWTLGDESALSKTEIWRPVPAMLQDFPLLGVGRGAFVAVYPRYRQAELPATFTHLENEWLQALVDWGAAGALLLAGLVLAFVRLLKSAGANPLHVAVASGLLFLAVHNLGDFNLELTAVALPAIMLLAAFTRSGGDEADPRGRSLSMRTGWLVAAVPALVVPLCGWSAVAHELRRDTARLFAALEAPGTTAEGRAASAAEVIARHPADYLLPLIVGQRELQESDGAARALRWINRGMFLAPGFTGSHRLAGHALLRLGAHEQGLMELRLACDAAPALARSMAREVWGVTRSAAAVAALAGETPRARLAVARVLLELEAFEEARAVVEEARAPGERGAGERVAGERVAGKRVAEEQEALQVAATALLALGRNDEALARAVELERRAPASASPYLLQSRAHVAGGDPEAARRVLARGAESARPLDSILFAWASLELSQGRLDEARRQAQRMLEHTGLGRGNAQAHWLLGEVHRRQGRMAVALREYEQARSNAPDHLGYHVAIIRLRLALNDLHGARAELERAELDAGPAKQLEALRAHLDQAAAVKQESLMRRQLLEDTAR